MKKKILFLINTLNGGGAEKVLVDTVNNMNKDKFDITVQTVIDEGVQKSNLNSNVRYKSIIKLKNPILKRLFTYIVCFVLPCKFVYKCFIRDKYDFEVAFLEGVPTKLLSVSKNTNKIAWVHTDLMKNYCHEKIFKTVDEHRNCYKKYKKIYCVSSLVEQMFKKRFGEFNNTAVQFNVLEDEKIQNLANESCEIDPKDGLRFITVGRLVYQKGYDRLINIFARLAQEGKTPQLLILGEGPEREKLQNQLEVNRLTNIKLIGFQDNPYKYISNADIFVCSSRAEGFSTVATEAILLGKPVITTDCAGMRDLLGDSEYGMITENAEEALYQGINKLIENEELREHYHSQALNRRAFFKKETRIEEIEKIFCK